MLKRQISKGLNECSRSEKINSEHWFVVRSFLFETCAEDSYDETVESYLIVRIIRADNGYRLLSEMNDVYQLR